MEEDELKDFDDLKANSKWYFQDPKTNKTRNIERVHVQVKKTTSQ